MLAVTRIFNKLTNNDRAPLDLTKESEPKENEKFIYIAINLI